MIYGCKEGHQLSCRDYPNCEGCGAFVDIRTQASTGIEIVPDYKNQWRTQETDVNEVLRILESLYNDFTMRRDEEMALDFAIKFIKEHTDGSRRK